MHGRGNDHHSLPATAMRELTHFLEFADVNFLSTLASGSATRLCFFEKLPNHFETFDVLIRSPN